MMCNYYGGYHGVAYVGVEPFLTNIAWCAGHDKAYKGISPNNQYRSFCFWLGAEGDGEQ